MVVDQDMSNVSPSDHFGAAWPPSSNRTKQDMFDLTVLKLHSMNRPARRDSSLRKSVLIFNLLRCLQQQEDPYERYDDGTISNAARSQDADAITYLDEEMDDESCPLDSDEARYAVNSLTAIEGENERGGEENSNSSYEFSQSTETSWSSSTSCGTAESELMDIDDHVDDSPSLISALSPCAEDNGQQRLPDRGLITESYHLLEAGSPLSSDGYQLLRNKSYGDYRPFDASNGFNLLT